MPSDKDAEREGIAAEQKPAAQRIELGGFEIVEKIGRGGMGAVYKARQMSMDRVVALKLLPPRLARSEAYVQRFIREAHAAARLNHPNIVQGIDVGQSGEYYYFAMEYVEGETAAERVKRSGPMGEADALAICAQVARALQHAHSRANIVHRDVKPQNILLANNGATKLADLGLARDAVKAEAGEPGADALGTPDYVSPEQIRGEAEIDGRADIYSLGATLYYLVTGSTPYAGETGNVIMAQHLTAPVPNLAAERRGISAYTAAIVRRAMQKDKSARYQSAGEMADAIEAAARRIRNDVAPDVARRAARLVRRRRRTRIAPLVLVLVVLLCAIAIMLAVRLARFG